VARTAEVVPERQSVIERRSMQRQSALRIALRVTIDAMAVLIALFGASIIRFELLEGAPALQHGWTYLSLTLISVPIWLALFWIYGLYEPRQVLSPVNEFKQVFHGVVAGTVVLLIADSALNMNMARGWALLAMFSGFVAVGGERLALRKTLHFFRRRGGDKTRTLVLGANHEGRTVANTLEREGWLGYEIVGFLDDDLPSGEVLEDGHEVIAPVANVTEVIARSRVNLVLIAATAFETPRLNKLFWELQDCDVDLQITSGTVDLLASRMTVQSVAGVPLLYVRRTGISGLQRTMKRTMDLLGSLVLIVVLSPLLLGIALWIRRDSKGPAIFKQVRTGRDGEPFTLWKFRTMVVDAEQKLTELEHLSEGPGLLFKLKEDPRITTAGRWLRRYSLDELAQLFNVLRGEMSLVGPRPALPLEVEQYDDWVRNRLRVKPGMTGLWQVSGRAETSFADYIRYDLFYIQNWSLSLDLWILWRTFRAVISGEGAH
jgi:exopolysaccharide biosynthesis polyprenyl glycosylphosphotransferase